MWRRRAVRSGGWVVLLAAAALPVRPLPAADVAAGRIKEKVKLFPYTVRLKLRSPGELNRSQVKFAAIPGGRHVGLSYTGVTDPEAIARYTKLGFRTSVSVTPATSAETVRALEDAGADVVIGYGGTKSEMGLTPQEAFDGSAAWRLNLLGKARRSRVAISGYYNMRVGYELPLDRQLGRYLYTIHDSNYLACNTWAAGYPVLVGRNRTPEQVLRRHNTNRAAKAPNTLVYYQTLANILQGVVEMISPGEVTTIALREFQDKDLEQVKRFIGRYGRDPRIWHTTQHAIAGYAYLVEKSRLLDVRAVGSEEIEIALGLEQDTYLPFCMAPLCLRLPKDLPVASARLGPTECPVFALDHGLFVDVPLREAFAATCALELERPASMTIPEDMPVTLTIRNAGDRPIADARLQWSSNVGMEVLCKDTGAFSLAGGAQRQVKAAIRTIRGPRRGRHPRGARFGLAPISAYVSCKADGEERFALASWEIVVAPRLRVEMDPRELPIPKDQSFPVFLHLANGRTDTRAGWSHFGPDKFIDHRAGACRGTVGLLLPEGMEAAPAKRTFELGEGDHATLRFDVHNRRWGDAQPVYVRPAVVFDGETEPIEVPWYGTRVMRDEATHVRPLDEEGLLARASWDDPKQTRGDLDAAAGSKVQHCPGATGGGTTPSNEGVSKWCLGWDSNVAFDSVGNIDYRRGTVLFWWRRDPVVRNDIRVRAEPAESWKVPGQHKNYGEKLFCVGVNRDLILRRFPRTRGREGYLELLLREMPVRGRATKVHHVQAELATAGLHDWRHIAIAWDTPARRLELYLDGRPAGRAEKGEGEWLVLPFDRGRRTNNMVLVETHHGHWSGSNRDELSVYNRPLSVEEIRADRARIRK